MSPSWSWGSVAAGRRDAVDALAPSGGSTSARSCSTVRASFRRPYLPSFVPWYTRAMTLRTLRRKSWRSAGASATPSDRPRSAPPPAPPPTGAGGRTPPRSQTAVSGGGPAPGPGRGATRRGPPPPPSGPPPRAAAAAAKGVGRRGLLLVVGLQRHVQEDVDLLRGARPPPEPLVRRWRSSNSVRLRPCLGRTHRE